MGGGRDSWINNSLFIPFWTMVCKKIICAQNHVRIHARYVAKKILGVKNTENILDPMDGLEIGKSMCAETASKRLK